MAIYDVFETENFAAYSGSYNARVMYGDFFSDLANGNRICVADRISGVISASFFNQDYTYLSSFALNVVSGTYIGHNARYLTLPCNQETWVDSCMISPLYYTYVNDGIPIIDERPMSGSSRFSIPDIRATGSAAIFFGYTTNVTALDTDPDNTTFADYKWPFRFPFMSMYKGLARSFRQSYNAPYSIESSVSWSFDANNGFRNSAALRTARLGRLMVIVPTDTGTTSFVAWVQDPIYVSGAVGYEASPYAARFPDRDINEIATISEQNKAYFGIGNNRYKIAGDGLSAKQSSAVRLCRAIKVRGWKYGAYNGNMVGTTAVFRTGHYGHLRDMLEQRQFSKFFDNEERKVLGGAVSVTPLSGTLLYTNMIDYVTATNPDYNARDSGAWDFEYRSGQPFFDM